MESSESEKRDDWRSVQARIVACEQTLLGNENMSSEGYIPADYWVTFSYEVNGRTHTGTYKANSLQEPGKTIEILYNPERPAQNSLSDSLSNPWIKWGATLVGVALVIIAIWLWGDQEWFGR